MSPAAFQPWRDYLQLGKLVERMSRCGPCEGREGEEEPALQAAALWPEQRQQRERQLFPRQQQQQQRRTQEKRRQRQQQQRERLLDPPPPSAPRRGDEPGCSFCRQNGESRSVYASHRLKDDAGLVQCPILRKYKCPQCGASGDFAHTRRFCPLTKQGYTSVYTSCLRNSAGKRKKKVS